METQLARARAIIDHLQDAVVDCDIDSFVVGWNAAAEKLFGYTAVEVLGRHVEFLVPPDRKGEVVNTQARILQGAELRAFETERLHKDGSRVPVSVSASIVIDDDGTPIGTSGILRDITERKKAEKELRRYQAIIDSTDVAIIVIDLEGTILSWNRGAERMYGYSAAEAVGSDARRLVPPERVQEFETNIAAGPVHNQETLRQTRDGQLIEISLSVTPLHDDSGNVVALCGFSTDITQRLKAERRWRSLVENAPSTIVMVDRDLRIVFTNRTETARRVEDVVGLSVDCFVAPHERERVRDLLGSVFETGEPLSYETMATDADGSPIGWYSSRVGPVIRNGEVESLIIIATNVTEKKKTDEELAESRSRLRSLSARLQSAQEEERLHIARELHDEMGQLLTALKLDLAWLESRLENDALLERTEAMGELVDTTIETARRIASRLRPRILDDLGLAAAVDWLVQDVCERAGLEYALHVELGGRRVEGDRALAVFRICQEALTNVVRHADASRVEITLTCDDTDVLLTIADDGKGIAPGQVSAEQSLGLPGLRERALMLGGGVEVQGAPGAGTLISARIPHAPA